VDSPPRGTTDEMLPFVGFAPTGSPYEVRASSSRAPPSLAPILGGRVLRVAYGASEGRLLSAPDVPRARLPLPV